MDAETTELIRSLCTRAGMIMEDVSSVAILVGTDDAIRQEHAVVAIERASADISALAAAARTLLRSNGA